MVTPTVKPTTAEGILALAKRAKRAQLYGTLTGNDADSPPRHLGGHASLE